MCSTSLAFEEDKKQFLSFKSDGFCNRDGKKLSDYTGMGAADCVCFLAVCGEIARAGMRMRGVACLSIYVYSHMRAYVYMHTNMLFVFCVQCMVNEFTFSCWFSILLTLFWG